MANRFLEGMGIRRLNSSLRNLRRSKTLIHLLGKTNLLNASIRSSSISGSFACKRSPFTFKRRQVSIDSKKNPIVRH